MQLPGVRTRAAGCLPSPALRTPSQGCCQQGLALPELKNLSKSLLELGLECWTAMVPQFCGAGRVGPQGLCYMGITIGRARHLGPSGVFLTGSCLLSLHLQGFPSHLTSFPYPSSYFMPPSPHALSTWLFATGSALMQAMSKATSQPQLPGLVLLVPQIQQC